jgi:stage III sporulation protein SpoIIIAA
LLVLVAEPGVLIISEVLIRLQGVVSLVLLQATEVYENQPTKEKVQNKSCIKRLANYRWFSITHLWDDLEALLTNAPQ